MKVDTAAGPNGLDAEPIRERFRASWPRRGLRLGMAATRPTP